MREILYILLLTVCWSCAQNSKTEVYQNKRANILDVQDRVKEIAINDVLIGPISPLCIVGEYLIIGDVKSQDNLIHIFKEAHDHLKKSINRGYTHSYFSLALLYYEIYQDDKLAFVRINHYH